MQPVTRRRVRHSGKDGKFFRVQRLIEPLLLLQFSEDDTAQLLVMAHRNSLGSFCKGPKSLSLTVFPSVLFRFQGWRPFN